MGTARALTRAESEAFRAGVHGWLAVQPEGIFRETYRLAARRLCARFRHARPFEDEERVERRLAALARDGCIVVEKERQQAYLVVRAISWREDVSTNVPKRTVEHRVVADAETRIHRAMEILAYLADTGGTVESITALRRGVLAKYGPQHEGSRTHHDIATLEWQGWVERRTARVDTRDTVAVTITRAGRKAIEAYRTAHDGLPYPPPPDGARTASSPPAPAGAHERSDAERAANDRRNGNTPTPAGSETDLDALIRKLNDDLAITIGMREALATELRLAQERIAQMTATRTTLETQEQQLRERRTNVIALVEQRDELFRGLGS